MEGASAAPPVGTIAMLFTDVASSTELARSLGSRWREILAAHHAIVGGAITAAGGWIDGTEGDAFFATFSDPAAAGRAAVAAQRALRTHAWPTGVSELKVRMGLHVGHVERAATGYLGLEVHHAARIAGAAHGGQLLLSEVAARMLGETVPSESLGAHRLKDFPQPENLFCAVIDGQGARAFPPPRTEATRPNNLPPGAPPLIGRDAELALLRGALGGEHERLVTVTGRGGSGKTTLALAAAEALLDDFSGGVWLVRLANVAGAEGVARAIASAVGAALDTVGTASEATVARLRERGRTLLVLDNCEHVLEAAPDLAALLSELRELQILATSQAPLRLSEEFVIGLDALADEDALALVERIAQRRNPGISVAGDDRQALLELVHLLDGLPLALEVAAARLALLSASQLVRRLRASPDVLRDDRADRPERQRSLRATVQWSLDLLEPEQRRLFARLGAFAGPAELEELEAVCGSDGLDVVGALLRLLEVALVRRVEDGDGRVRFGLPEGLRRIAGEDLDHERDSERWRRAHAERQREIVSPARYPSVSQSEYDAAAAAIAERRLALRWAWSADRELARTLAGGHAAVAAELGLMREAVETVEPLLVDPPSSVDAVIASGIGVSWALMRGRPDEALPYAECAVDAAETPREIAMALSLRSVALSFSGRMSDSVHATEQAVDHAREAGDAVLATALIMQAQAHLAAGDLPAAARSLDVGSELITRTDLAMAWKRFTVQGDLAAAEGRPADALALYSRSLQEAERRGNDTQIVLDLVGVAAALGTVQADAGAVEVEGMARALLREMGGASGSQVHLLDRSDVERARERLGTDASESAQRGRTVEPALRVTRACELVGEAMAARGAGPVSPAAG